MSFKTIANVKEQLETAGYICSKTVSTVVFLAEATQKPILVEGPAGVGKTELAKAVAKSMDRELIRLQCYEGLDEAKALYEWEYAKQLLYTQMVKDKIEDVISGSQNLSEAVDKIAEQEDAFFSERFIQPRPLLKAISSENPVVLLIDEVDKSDPEFEAFLLEVLSDFQVTIPEIGTRHAVKIPFVILTSNNYRDMSDALKRRCIHLYIDYPDTRLELEIVKLKIPQIEDRLAEQLIRTIHEIRNLDLKKKPCTSETLDWAQSLIALQVMDLTPEIVSDTLNLICKYRSDTELVIRNLEEISKKRGISMVNLILRFVSCSRAAGLRISSSEVLDCLNHLEYIDPTDEPLFKDVLRSNFAKSRREQARFNHLYQLFFHELRSDISLPRAESLGELMASILDAVEDSLDGTPALQAILDFLRGDPLAYLEEMRHLQTDSIETPQGLNSSFAPLVQRLEIMSQINAVSATIGRFLTNNRSTISWENRQALTTHFNNQLENARRMLREDPEDFIDTQNQVLSYDQHLNKLGEKSFASLSRREVEEMRDIIEQLVRKLKDTVQRRHIKKSRGVLDIKKTLRLSAKYQGVPVELVFRERPKRKGKIVTLCDVSGSVWSAAKFMLNMLYSLQDCFLQVRSFIFVSELAEVTDVFENHEINQAIDKALQEGQINYNASTDYGRTFRQFKKDYMDILNKKTTLIIIGDGRTNYTNPEEEILGEMRDKCRRIVWLNPESLVFWHTGDSRMKTYEAYCNQVRHCQNLNQLMEFIKDLVL